MSPDASASRTVCSGTSSPRSTRSSNGLFAAERDAIGQPSGRAVERAVDDVHLLLAAEPHEVHRVSRDADRQARILLGVLHRVEQRVAVQHVDVHVEAGRR
jgi:hypothetical protein